MQTKNREITVGCDLKNNEDFLDAMRYCYNDILSVEKCKASMELRADIPGMIDRVIFNKPATIILWKDGTKTVVKKAYDDTWDPEKGFCMAIIKKLYGNTSFIKRFMESEEEMSILNVEEACENLKNFGKKLFAKNNK
jgi:hypothetical protein